MRRALLLSLLVLVAGLGADAAGQASAVDPVSTTVYPSDGTVPLRTGFVPDPAVLSGVAEGEGPMPLREPAECMMGFFERAPSHVFDFQTRVGFLRFYATGPGDLVLAVRDAEGRWHCNDDRFGRHPSVEGTWTRGRVEVWVGTHGARDRTDYQLRLTETRSMRPGVGPDSSDAGDESDLAEDAGMVIDADTGRFDGIRLRRGFLPDPRFLAGDSTVTEDEGGTDASLLGGQCHGVVSHAPSHVITLLDDFDFVQLYLLPLDLDHWPSDENPALSLIVLQPDGTFVCDDASDGIEISSATWVPGIYRVWIGTENGEAPRPYRMGISEIRRVRGAR